MMSFVWDEYCAIVAKSIKVLIQSMILDFFLLNSETMTSINWRKIYFYFALVHCLISLKWSKCFKFENDETRRYVWFNWIVTNAFNNDILVLFAWLFLFFLFERTHVLTIASIHSRRCDSTTSFNNWWKIFENIFACMLNKWYFQTKFFIEWT